MRERQRSDRARDDDDDVGYLDLDQLARYSSLSVRTLQRYIKDPVHPLPHVHVRRGTARGRVLVSKRAFDRWMQQFAVGDGSDDPTDTSWIRRAFGK